MLTIRIPREVWGVVHRACERAGMQETGGMLFGEHVADDEFCVIEATVAGTGSFARFIRDLHQGLKRLERFFRRTGHDYQRFNYLGEWHSHPSFALRPSSTDDTTMFEIVDDPSTGARFAVSVIVKLANTRLAAKVFVYFPGGVRETGRVVLEGDNVMQTRST